jgi:hypothetical protein
MDPLFILDTPQSFPAAKALHQQSAGKVTSLINKNNTTKACPT